ncbi:DinB family protein [Rhodohalobacter sp. SW132]|uniref:DinB family protein n=1 Tax=Rhodohalobacter sp. SW132 TaxID=2293433 RepID=UPI0013158064|nr:DinB family protein [Rhodohalobacter sp. SW132]
MKNLQIPEPLLIQFDLHHRLYNNVLEGFTDEESNRRLTGFPQLNHVKYLAGHLLNSQYGIAAIAGLKPDIKWNDLFAVMGQSEAKDGFAYPSLEEIKTEWNHLHEPTLRGLKELQADDLNLKPPSPFDQVSENIGQLWAFISHHQAYHIGQIGILRRAFGKEPMSYQ